MAPPSDRAEGRPVPKDNNALTDGRIAIVTGGATGIGRAIGIALARDGANIVVADMNREAAEATATEIADVGVTAMAVTVDVRRPERLQRMTDAVLERFGSIDILVNNAGVAGAPGWHHESDSREDDWIACYEVNVKGTMNTTSAVAPAMKRESSGKIVNIASIAGREGRPAHPHYSASKAAIINYTQSLAIDLGPYNINVNAVCPGLLWTPMWVQVGERYARHNRAYADMEPRAVFDRMISEIIPLGREQTPEDIGDCVTFLASDDASAITGQAVNVDGGAFLR